MEEFSRVLIQSLSLRVVWSCTNSSGMLASVSTSEKHQSHWGSRRIIYVSKCRTPRQHFHGGYWSLSKHIINWISIISSSIITCIPINSNCSLKFLLSLILLFQVYASNTWLDSPYISNLIFVINIYLKAKKEKFVNYFSIFVFILFRFPEFSSPLLETISLSKLFLKSMYIYFLV